MVSVIFDLEGTLVQSVGMDEQVILEFRRETRRKLIELRIPEDTLAGIETSTLMRNKAKQYADENLSITEKLKLMQGLDRFLLEYELKWAKNSTLLPDAEPVLKILKSRGVRMAIVTNTSRQAAETMLAKHGLSGYFTSVITRNDVERLKPDPQGILLAMDRLCDRDPLFVGDLPIDSEAARRAGIRSALVKRNWPPFVFSSVFQADHVVESLSDIPMMLQENRLS